MNGEYRYMKMALSLGRRGLGAVWPNPSVGCVIVKDGRIVGRGVTQPSGRPHAEVVALAQAGASAKGATAYVTLEPCAHHGQTPPCADALIAAGIARVVAPLEDSDARVSGRGFAMLRDAGIEVETGICASDAARDHAGFFLKTEQNRPFLTLKLALTLDGRIATRTGDSRWITGPQARRRVHALRANHDAVLVGGGTARADDPSLTVRGLGISRQPVRVIASRNADIPVTSSLFKTAQNVPVWICHSDVLDDETRQAWKDAGALLVECEGADGAVAPRSMMTGLAKQGITRIFCEGGGALAASLMKAGLVDRLIIHSAGVVIGADGKPGIGAMEHSVLKDIARWKRVSVQALGQDVETVWERL